MGTLLSLSGENSTHKDDGRLCNPRLDLHILCNRLPISQFNITLRDILSCTYLLRKQWNAYAPYASIKTTLGYISLGHFFLIWGKKWKIMFINGKLHKKCFAISETKEAI